MTVTTITPAKMNISRKRANLSIWKSMHWLKKSDRETWMDEVRLGSGLV